MAINGINVVNLTRVPSTTQTIYSGTSLQNSMILWIQRGFTNTSGQALFYPTSDGTINGTPLFNNLFSVQVMAQSGIASAVNIPTASLKEINFLNKEIVCNVVKGITLGIVGDTIQFAGGGIPVYCEIKGN